VSRKNNRRVVKREEEKTVVEGKDRLKDGVDVAKVVSESRPLHWLPDRTGLEHQRRGMRESRERTKGTRKEKNLQYVRVIVFLSSALSCQGFSALPLQTMPIID